MLSKCCNAKTTDIYYKETICCECGDSVNEQVNTPPLNLNIMSELIYKKMKAKGFWDNPRNVGEMLMLQVSELGEAMEAHRKDRLCIDAFTSDDYNKTTDEEFKTIFESKFKDTFEDEIADAIIRILDMCGGLNIDIDKHIALKMRYNAMRERLHGKKY